MAQRLVRDNSHCIIVDNSGNRRIVRIRSQHNPKQLHFKHTIDVRQLIGKPYGSFFQIIDDQEGTLVEITDQKQLVQDFFLKPAEDSGSDGEDVEPKTKVQKTTDSSFVPISTETYVVKGDNRFIVDDTNKQKLGENQINSLKDQGVGGEAIIQQLIQNSATYNMKTQFSKEKWLKRKQQKYMITFEVREPTAVELCDTYHIFSPHRICYLRSDMMGYKLNLSNVNADSRVLLVENTKGLMTGALMEREPKYILRVEFGHEAIKVNNEILFQFDHSTDAHTSVASIHGKLLIPLDKKNPDPLTSAMQAKYKKHFNSFVFVHDELHPSEVFMALKHLLQPSASFAIYSTSVQPLSELLNLMNFHKDTVNAKIEELWTREQQVLPLRTHPFMSTNGQSGFCLTGQKLA